MSGQCTESFLGLCSFVEAASSKNLGVVILGGLLGGILQPVVAKLNPRADDPPTSSYWQSPLLGIAAAGITVYVVAQTKTGDPIPLLFFSLLCGLAFPAILTAAVDNVSKKTAQVEKQVKQIADDAKNDDIGQTVEAAQNLRTTLLQNPSSSVKPEGRAAIELAGQQAVANIAQTAITTPEAERQVVDELKDVGTIAVTAGYDQTAKAVADQLQKLSENSADDATKTVAAQAAERLNDGNDAA